MGRAPWEWILKEGLLIRVSLKADTIFMYFQRKGKTMKNDNLASEEIGAKPDYSREECWFKIPEISKDIDTFYVYATEYIMSSF